MSVPAFRLVAESCGAAASQLLPPPLLLLLARLLLLLLGGGGTLFADLVRHSMPADALAHRPTQSLRLFIAACGTPHVPTRMLTAATPCFPFIASSLSAHCCSPAHSLLQ